MLIPLKQVKDKLETQRESLFTKGCKLNKFHDFVIPSVSPHHMPLINEHAILLEDDYFDHLPINPKLCPPTNA